MFQKVNSLVRGAMIRQKTDSLFFPMFVKRLVTLFTSLTLATAGVPAIAANDVDLNLPSLGTVAGADLTLTEEREYGEEIMRHIRADAAFLSDDETVDYLNRLGYRLVAAGRTQPYDFFFFPIRDKSLNAFALPGGFIAVHTGLVVAAETESELAGVIGHEIGHVTQRHIARMIEQSKGSLAMTVGSILLAILAARTGGNSGGNAAVAIAMGTQAAMIQKQLAYSRDAEREADRVGLTTLANAGFDPKGMESFFSKLQQNSRYYETASTAYLSTHPLTGERMSDVQNRTRSMPVVHHRDSLDFKLIRERLRVLQETRYDGYLTAARSMQSALKTAMGNDAVALHYGLSVAYEKLGRTADALKEAKSARALVSTESVLLDKNLAEASFNEAKSAKEKDAALALAKRTVSNHPYSSMLASTYADMLFRAGKNTEVIRYLRNQKALSKRNADYFSLLARSYEALGKRAEAFAATGDMYILLGNDKAALYQFEKAQRASDADFYVMSQIDAKLRTLRNRLKDEKK